MARRPSARSSPKGFPRLLVGTIVGLLGLGAVLAVALLAQARASGPSASANAGRFAVLLMGYGGGDHPGAYLTDSLLLVIVDPNARALTLLSVPRDSWAPLAFSPKDVVYNKINTAYALARDGSQFGDRRPVYRGAQGPGTFAADSVSRLLGVPVRYYLGLDFEGFRQMIDAVGGIDVAVPDTFSARYPANDDPAIDASWKTVRFTKGIEHMDGERAIEFARAREAIDNPDEGTDFARSRRQRLIIEAFKRQVMQPGGLVHLPRLLAIARQHADTNYSLPDVVGLLPLVLTWRNVQFYQAALTTGNYLEDGTGPDGTYVVVPAEPDHAWTQVHGFARHLWSDPAVGVAMATISVRVENDNGINGLAGRVSGGLLQLGYQVDAPITGPVQKQTRIVDRTGGKAAPLINALEQDLQLGNVPVVTENSIRSNADDSSGVVLQLGTDREKLAVEVPEEPAAPVSAAGVVKFGSWP
ncbi:MAG TPA: LCP family protein [Chloroflexota bacterium]|nr:LCP family protein [Chloroflexota bacterium]